MLSWPLAFLIITCLAALLGFTGMSGLAGWMARAVAALFLVLFLVAMAFKHKRSSKEEDSRQAND